MEHKLWNIFLYPSWSWHICIFHSSGCFLDILMFFKCSEKETLPLRSFFNLFMLGRCGHREMRCCTVTGKRHRRRRMWQAGGHPAGMWLTIWVHQARKEICHSSLALSHQICCPLSLKVGSHAYGGLVSQWRDNLLVWEVALHEYFVRVEFRLDSLGAC